MDVQRLWGFAALCGVATFVGVLLPWAVLAAGPVSMSMAGTDVEGTTIIWILALAGALSAGTLALGITGELVPAPAVRGALAIVLLALAAILTVAKCVDFGDGMMIFRRGSGLWISTLASVGGAACALMAFFGGPVRR